MLPHSLILQNMYCNSSFLSAEDFRFFLERIISGAELLEMALKDGIVAFIHIAVSFQALETHNNVCAVS